MSEGQQKRADGVTSNLTRVAALNVPGRGIAIGEIKEDDLRFRFVAVGFFAFVA
jgi:hypothetical protein